MLSRARFPRPKNQSGTVSPSANHVESTARQTLSPVWFGPALRVSPFNKFARVQQKLGNGSTLPTLSHRASAIQTKLTINQPGDQYEQEADRAADQVMRMPDPGTAEKPNLR